MPDAFGNYTTDDFDYNLGDDTEWDDPDIVFATVHKARAEVIAIGDDRDELREQTSNMGVPKSEFTTVCAPFNPEWKEDFSFPNLP